MFSLGQGQGFYYGPNAYWDNLLVNAGKQPRSSSRDVFREIANALRDAGVPLIAYIATDLNSRNDPEGTEVIGFDPNNKSAYSADYLSNVAGIFQQFSDNYGDLIRGWWLDEADFLRSQEDRDVLVSAAKHGNGNAVVAMNVFGRPLESVASDDDFTAGEGTNPNGRPPIFSPPADRWSQSGNLQWHELFTLSGDGYGTTGVYYNQDDLNNEMYNLRAGGGAITWELLYNGGYYPNGDAPARFDQAQIDALAAARQFLNDNP